jgi:DNA modification methylase
MNPLKIDRQTVYFKSSEEIHEVGDAIDLIITSPPYWNLKDYGHQDQIGHDERYEQYLDRLQTVWNECYRVSKEDAIMIINIGSRRHKKKFYPIGMDIYNGMDRWKLVDNLIWYIPNSLPQPAYYLDKLFDDKYENLLIFAKNYKYDYTFNKIRVEQKYKGVDPREGKLNDKGRSVGNVLKMRAYRPPTIKDQNYHAAAYPEELIYALMYTFSNPGDKVLDPFLGSGTTLKVARKMNRTGFGYEIDQDYHDLISERIQEDMEEPHWEQLDILSNAKPASRTKKSKTSSLSDFGSNS